MAKVKDQRKQKLSCQFCNRPIRGPGPLAKHENSCDANPDFKLKPKRKRKKRDPRQEVQPPCPYCGRDDIVGPGPYAGHIAKCERKKRTEEVLDQIAPPPVTVAKKQPTLTMDDLGKIAILRFANEFAEPAWRRKFPDAHKEGVEREKQRREREVVHGKR